MNHSSPQQAARYSGSRIEKVVKTKGAIEVTENPNKKKYSHQKIFVVEINDYIYLVPFVEDDKKYFLKTFYPSRKAVKKYIKRNEKNEEKVS